MTRNLRSFLLKIFMLTTVMVVGFFIGQNIINAINNDKVATTNNIQTSNQNTYKNTNIPSLGKTGVAITTNIGTKYKQRTEIPATIYSDVFSVNQLIQNKEAGNNELIASNMIITEEYKNVLKTDVKGLLGMSNNRSEILDAFIEQLEFRYEKTVKQINSLNEQKAIFEGEMIGADSKIEILKTKINVDFKAKDPIASKENIDEYLKQKNNYYHARTYIIYINKFLLDYEALNNYNKKLLDTLINNKDAIIKEAYIVIPDTGIEFLRDFNLLYDETEFKAK